MPTHFSQLAYAYGQPTVTGQFKQSPADFVVKEQLSFEPSGEGEHLFLQIKKTNLNTLDVCERIAKHFHVQARNVAYAGLKDKNAVTLQWFSLPFPLKATLNLSGFESEQLCVVSSTRNSKKLKHGAIKSNQFEISLRDVQGDTLSLADRVSHIKEFGVPNYFGSQRFGHNENNLINAVKLFSNKIKCSRNKKSLYLSAARSFLFNEVVSQRVKDNTWNTIIPGDVATLNDSRSFFPIEQLDESIEQRLQEGDIHLSAPLWGKGESISSLEVKELEEKVINSNVEIADGLINEGLQQDRRAMRVYASNIECQLNDNILSLKFSLPSGAYATAVLREILITNE